LFKELDYGKAYIFKGNSNKLAYFLQDEPNVKIFTQPNLGYLNNSSCVIEPTNYIMLYRNYKTLPDELYLSELVRVFIVFDPINDTLNKDIKNLIKHYESKYYSVLDFSSYSVNKDPQLKTLIEQVKLDPNSNLAMFQNWKDYYHYPLALQQIIEDPCRKANDLQVKPIGVLDYIKELARTKNFKYVTKLAQLNTNILNDYFTPPFRLFSGKIIEDKELTWQLFYWYKLFYTLNKNVLSLSSNDLVYLFFSWVYRASTINIEGNNTGLKKAILGSNSRRYNKVAYFFNPSSKACDEFYRDLLGLTVSYR